jgi:hypothetical protein
MRWKGNERKEQKKKDLFKFLPKAKHGKSKLLVKKKKKKNCNDDFIRHGR